MRSASGSGMTVARASCAERGRVGTLARAARRSLTSANSAVLVESVSEESTASCGMARAKLVRARRMKDFENIFGGLILSLCWRIDVSAVCSMRNECVW